MINPKEIEISNYNYTLPDERIAKYPIAQRDNSKLLVFDKGDIREEKFFNIVNYLPKKDLLVFNNTRVIQARIHFNKSTGALIEVFLLEPYAPADYEQMFQAKGECTWKCLVGNLKKWKGGELIKEIPLEDGSVRISCEHKGAEGTSQIVTLKWDRDDLCFSEIIDLVGELPIPPYLNRDTEESDKTTYQTVYSKIKGSVAAPTAGLHFTERVLADIDSAGVERAEVTLHVGAGTFRPVKSQYISDHDMHTEYFAVSKSTLEQILAHDCRVTAVGTTSVRTIESLYYIGCNILNASSAITDNELHVCQWQPYENTYTATPAEAIEAIIGYLDDNNLATLNASTQIIIAPGYTYKFIKQLVTNFHQPQSTLLLLVSALVGERWHDIYRYALDNDFRFLSYGDSSLLMP